ncbi:MAG: hypothetical protein Q7U38_04840 [Methylobacter sp.]|nr:hypothetical protein [Methylobacter sp.]MDP2100111.1 hypothetical protein [Methylobacter sp.]MDP2429445.1 hypothetical protein [Methylobacter sp.]MDP3055570.1 hypothetical protein [Methylobacter sp.]MDP3363418.1 hypothetical protein [Methylobacter sp.]
MAAKTQSVEKTNNKNVVNFIPEPVETSLSVMDSALVAIANLPDLSTAALEPISLDYAYWSPQSPSEFKRGVVIGIENAYYDKVDEKTGELTEQLELPCLIFAEQQKDGTWTKISNGSKRLVALAEHALKTGSIIAGRTPIQIKYLGKVRNTTNQYSCDNFQVTPLTFNIS